MLYLISLGLTPNSLAQSTLDILAKCKVVHLESYTSIMHTSFQYLGVPAQPLTREDMEGEGEWLGKAKENDIAVCVGDSDSIN
jgi:diphthamide biosynthesis methyltransferase